MRSYQLMGQLAVQLLDLLVQQPERAIVKGLFGYLAQRVSEVWEKE